MIWVASSVVAISWAAVGIYMGLATQEPGRQPAAGLCEYRVELVRDRLINLLEQGPGQVTAPTGAKFSNLLRETRALCAGSDPDTLRKLGRIEALHHDFDDRSSRTADARQELFAL